MAPALAMPPVNGWSSCSSAAMAHSEAGRGRPGGSHGTCRPGVCRRAGRGLGGGGEGWAGGGGSGGAGDAPGVGDVECAVGGELGGPAGPVGDVVVPRAQQHEVGEVGGAALLPPDDVVGFAPGAGPVAAFPAAVLVAAAAGRSTAVGGRPGWPARSPDGGLPSGRRRRVLILGLLAAACSDARHVSCCTRTVDRARFLTSTMSMRRAFRHKWHHVVVRREPTTT